MTRNNNQKRYKILLVDDDRSDAHLIERLLDSKPGLLESFDWVSTADQAIELANQKQFDVILLDYYLGNETGLEFMERMPASIRNIAVVMLTGKEEDEADESSLGQGVESFLEKSDLDSKLLIRTIRYAHKSKDLKNRLTDFANILAHDLNGPTTNITGLLQLIKTTIGSSDKATIAELIDNAVAESSRLSNTIQSLQSYCESKSGNISIQSLDLSDKIDEAMLNISSELTPRGAKIEKGEMGRFEGDPVLIVHLFKNLIQNAIKYNKSDAPKIVVTSKQLHEEIQISFSDNGIGIPEEFLNRIFNPMERVSHNKKTKGTGLGLAICREIVESHGGKLWAESDGEGHGTTFQIILPNTHEHSK